ncbi:MAG TPA: shikimate kinase [Candidatus Norongarragalinales archaeon]|nr:shikimate kinase [Candidatus Norongarragalinales archaeon]
MKQKNILLVGFMGSGKTTVGKALAEKRLMNFLDLDEEFEKYEGKRIVRIFEEKGESYFRDREAYILKKFSKEKSAVIATGGGIVLREDNRNLLKRLGTRVWLDASSETIYENTRHQKYRPLLDVQDRKEFIVCKLNERKPLYEQADVRVVVDGKTVDQIVEEIEEKLHA